MILYFFLLFTVKEKHNLCLCRISQGPLPAPLASKVVWRVPDCFDTFHTNREADTALLLSVSGSLSVALSSINP